MTKVAAIVVEGSEVAVIVSTPYRLRGERWCRLRREHLNGKGSGLQKHLPAPRCFLHKSVLLWIDYMFSKF